MKEYFEGIKYDINAVIDIKNIEPVIPTEFKKNLNVLEKIQLLNDQLLYKGLQLDSIAFLGAKMKIRIVEANKNAKHIEEMHDRSNRIREYLEKFEQTEKEQ